MMVLLLAVIVPFAFTEDGATFFGLSEAVLGPIAHSTPSIAASAA